MSPFLGNKVSFKWLVLYTFFLTAANGMLGMEGFRPQRFSSILKIYYDYAGFQSCEFNVRKIWEKYLFEAK